MPVKKINNKKKPTTKKPTTKKTVQKKKSRTPTITNRNTITVNNVVPKTTTRRKSTNTTKRRTLSSRAPDYATYEQINKLNNEVLDQKLKNYDDKIKLLTNGNNNGKNNKTIKDDDKSDFEIPKQNIKRLSGSEKMKLFDAGKKLVFDNMSTKELNDEIKKLNGYGGSFKTRDAKINRILEGYAKREKQTMQLLTPNKKATKVTDDFLFQDIYNKESPF